MARDIYPQTSPTFQKLDSTKQKRILDAAIAEFSDHGFQGASINRIIARIGIAKGSIFQYFRNKDGLFVFVFQHALERVKTYLKKVRSETRDLDVFERIRLTLIHGVSFVRRNPRIYNIYLRIAFESGIPFRKELIQSIRTESVDYLASLLEHGVERGELRPDLDVGRAAFFLDAVLDRVLQAYSLRHLDAGLGLYRAPEETIEQWAEEFVKWLRIGMGA